MTRLDLTKRISVIPNPSKPRISARRRFHGMILQGKLNACRELETNAVDWRLRSYATQQLSFDPNFDLFFPQSSPGACRSPLEARKVHHYPVRVVHNVAARAALPFDRLRRIWSPRWRRWEAQMAIARASYRQGKSPVRIQQSPRTFWIDRSRCAS